MQATVEVIGKPRSNEYGEFRPIKLALEDGAEGWLNLKTSDPALESLRKGQVIDVWQNDKGNLRLQKQGQSQQSSKPATAVRTVDTESLVRQEVVLLNRVKDMLTTDLGISDPFVIATVYQQVSAKS